MSEFVEVEKPIFKRVVVIAKDRVGFNGVCIPFDLVENRGGKAKGIYLMNGTGVEFDADHHTLAAIEKDRTITVKVIPAEQTKPIPEGPDGRKIRRIGPDELIRSLGIGNAAAIAELKLIEARERISLLEAQILSLGAEPAKSAPAEKASDGDEGDSGKSRKSKGK